MRPEPTPLSLKSCYAAEPVSDAQRGFELQSMAERLLVSRLVHNAVQNQHIVIQRKTEAADNRQSLP